MIIIGVQLISAGIALLTLIMPESARLPIALSWVALVTIALQLGTGGVL